MFLVASWGLPPGALGRSWRVEVGTRGGAGCQEDPKFTLLLSSSCRVTSAPQSGVLTGPNLQRESCFLVRPAPQKAGPLLLCGWRRGTGHQGRWEGLRAVTRTFSLRQLQAQQWNSWARPSLRELTVTVPDLSLPLSVPRDFQVFSWFSSTPSSPSSVCPESCSCMEWQSWGYRNILL